MSEYAECGKSFILDGEETVVDKEKKLEVKKRWIKKGKIVASSLPIVGQLPRGVRMFVDLKSKLKEIVWVPY